MKQKTEGAMQQCIKWVGMWTVHSTGKERVQGPENKVGSKVKRHRL